MKILFVATAPPWPPTGGSSLRCYHFMRFLAPQHEVHLVCYATVRQELALRQGLGSVCQGIYAVTPPAPRGSWRRVVDLVASPLPDLALRFRHPAMRRLVSRLLATADFDLVHIIGLETASAVFSDVSVPRSVTAGSQREAKVVLDELNAEYLLQERAFQVERSSPARWPAAFYSWAQGRKLRRYEGLLAGSVAAVITVSDEDKAVLERLLPETRIGVVPNGVDTERYQPSASSAAQARCLPDLAPATPVLLFTGTMDFRPNVDAAVWFTQAILPHVLERVPRAHFAIVGRNPTTAVQRLSGAHVTVTGSVADDLPYFHRASLFVLPMRFGGGSRLKLLQAMACGLPVVTTRVGGEGVALHYGEHAVLADTPQDFARGVVEMLLDRDGAQRLGVQARQFALQFDWKELMPGLAAFYSTLTASPLRA